MISETMSGALSENLLTLLAHSDEHGKLVASIVDPTLFEGDLRVMGERLTSYWRTYGSAPKHHAPDLFADIIEDPHNRRAITFKRILTAMMQLSTAGINAKYVLGQLRLFTRLRKMQDAIIRAAEQLNSPGETTVQQVEEILGDILRARDFQFDPGLKLTDIDHLLTFLDTQYKEFDTGIPMLDENNVVPSRGTVYLVLGVAGQGKTWAMVHLGKRGLLRRKKVLHITLEVSAEHIQQRYYQALFSAPKRGDAIDVTRLDKERYNLVGMRQESIAPDFGFDSRTIRDELNTRVQLWGSRLETLVIKRFATRQLTMNGLRGYLDSLQSVANYTPDMLIIDYPKLMKLDMRDMRLSLGSTLEELRGLCIERNMAGVVAHQSSREGAKAKTLRMIHAGEDWSVAQTADIVVTMSATDAEQRFGLARLYADKVRTDKSNLAVLITQSYDLGQFVLDSFPLQARYFDYLSEYVEDAEPDEDEENDAE